MELGARFEGVSVGVGVERDPPDHHGGELFLMIEGQLTIQLRDRDVILEPGQLFVVPRGVEHCLRADDEVKALLLEPAGVVNTGGAGGDLTAVVEAI